MARNELKIEGAAFRRLLANVERAGERFPELRREMFEKIAKELPELVNRNINSVSPGWIVDDKHPKNPAATVWSWQDNPGRVGSKGGYAAVSPRAKTFKEGTDYAVGYLTNTLTHGTVNIRRPSGIPTKRPYVPRIKYGKIRRRPFYDNAAREFQNEKNAYVEQFAKELAELIGKAEE